MVELLTGVTQWRLLIVGLLMAGLALGLRRTDLDPGVRRRTWLAVSLPLLLWMVVVWRIALAGLFVPGRGVPGIPLAVLLPLLVGLPLLLRSATLAAVLDAVEPSWLVGFQVYRVLGAVFLVRWASGALPLRSRCRRVSATYSSESWRCRRPVVAFWRRCIGCWGRCSWCGGPAERSPVPSRCRRVSATYSSESWPCRWRCGCVLAPVEAPPPRRSGTCWVSPIWRWR